MPAREAESEMLARCVAAARGLVPIAHDRREANVFRVAAMIVRPRFPQDSIGLAQAGERYFELHPEDRLDSAEVVRHGWVISFPRLRDMLNRRLQAG